MSDVTTLPSDIIGRVAAGLEAAKAIMARHGFYYRHAAGVDFFQDEPLASRLRYLLENPEE